ncbi:MAG: stage II sporulation protein R [Desulfurispora sp.]|uniref:stage II sporulation protein R n=1 Tax=Desulfurispora sp. TaxID=3014275 RepID=UPI00404A2071
MLKSKAGKHRELCQRAGRCGAAIVLAVVWAVCWSASQYQYEQMCDLLRLHIVARSNTLADQRVKQQVLQAVLDSLARQGVEVAGAPAACAPVGLAAQSGPVPDAAVLCDAARQALQRAGAGYPVTVTLGQRDYPAKVLAGPLPRTVPAGEYTAVQIYLGEGRGYNWWGVLYPPLCFGVRSEHSQDGFGKITTHSRTGKTQLRSYFWDSMQKLLNL